MYTMQINNKIKSKIFINLSNKRCNVCFEVFHIKNMEIGTSSSYNAKIKFSFKRPLHHISMFHNASLLSSKHSSFIIVPKLTMVKERELVSIGFISLICSHCGFSKMIPINISDY